MDIYFVLCTMENILLQYNLSKPNLVCVWNSQEFGELAKISYFRSLLNDRFIHDFSLFMVQFRHVSLYFKYKSNYCLVLVIYYKTL